MWKISQILIVLYCARVECALTDAAIRNKRIQDNALLSKARKHFPRESVVRSFSKIFLRVAFTFVFLIRAQVMCGSILSKCQRPNNRIAPVPLKGKTVFPGLRRVPGQTKLVDISDEGLMHLQSVAAFKTALENSASSLLRSGEDDSSPEDASVIQRKHIDAEARAMESALAILSAQGRNNPNLLDADREMRALQSAREILAFQSSGASSSSTIASVPLNSTRSVLLKETKGAVAFEVLVGDNNTVCRAARKPRRLGKMKVAPRGGIIPGVNIEVLAAEEKRLRQLEHHRASATTRTAQSELKSASTSSWVTAERMAAQQAAAAEKRGEKMENRRQAGRRISSKQNSIAAAQAIARVELQSSIERKMEASEHRRAERRQMIGSKRREKEEQSRIVKENVS